MDVQILGDLARGQRGPVSRSVPCSQSQWTTIELKEIVVFLRTHLQSQSACVQTLNRESHDILFRQISQTLEYHANLTLARTIASAKGLLISLRRKAYLSLIGPQNTDDPWMRYFGTSATATNI